MRLFFNAFPIRDTLRHELSWSHYRTLLRVENEQERLFYLNEAVECAWSTRQLERQINSFYYRRLLASNDKNLVRADAEQHSYPVRPEELLKNPYVLEFMNLQEDSNYVEVDKETSLLNRL